MKLWLAAAVLAVLATLSVVGMSAPAAHADEADCAESPWLDGAFELVELPARLIPPPLQSGYDCALRAAGDDLDETLLPDGHYATGINYILIYVDVSFDEMVDFFRAFQNSGYMGGADINIVESPTGGTQTVALNADDVAALSPAPNYVHARFSHPHDAPASISPNGNIYAITWTDGVEYASDSGILGRPQIVANVILTEPYVVGTDLDDPSTLSDLRTIQDAVPTPAQWGVIGAGSLMLMLVVGWPSTLLNSVVGSRYQAMVHWVTTRVRRKPKDAVEQAASADPPATIRRSRLPGWLMWPGFALAAILGAFVDPDFGINLMSLRLVVTLFFSFVLFNLLAWTIVRRVAVRLQPDSDPYLRFRWGSLVLVILAVLVARLLGFEPGVIFGLVAGIAYATSLQAAKSAIVTIVGSAFGLAVALVAWVGYSLLAPVPIDNVGYVFLVEFLAGVSVKGVSTLPLSLLPLGTLDGAKVFGWRKLVWGVSYVVGLAAFMLVLATVPKAWGEVPDFLRWIWIFGAYAVIAIVVWALNSRMLKKKPLPPEAQQGDQPDAITID